MEGIVKKHLSEAEMIAYCVTLHREVQESYDNVFSLEEWLVSKAEPASLSGMWVSKHIFECERCLRLFCATLEVVVEKEGPHKGHMAVEVRKYYRKLFEQAQREKDLSNTDSQTPS